MLLLRKKENQGKKQKKGQLLPLNLKVILSKSKRKKKRKIIYEALKAMRRQADYEN